MMYIKESVGGTLHSVPVCIDCICASCQEPCGECPQDTDDGVCKESLRQGGRRGV